MTHDVFALDQASFRGREDDGSESTATWIDIADNDWTQKTDQNFRVRFLVQESGAGTASGTLDAQLQYNLGGAGWNNVTTSSSVVKAVASGDAGGPYDGTATVQRIGSGTFVAGTISEDGLAAQVSLSGDDETEIEFIITIIGSDVSDGNTLQLRITDASTTPSWTSTPTVTAQKPVEISADYLASAASIPEPTVWLQTQTISADYLASAASIPDPTLLGIATIDADYLPSASSVYDPTLQGIYTITPDHLASAASIPQPTLQGIATIQADYLASAAQVYDATVANASGLQNIDADYLASNASIPQPTVTGIYTMTADYLASASQVFDPTITTLATIGADYLASNAQIYQPQLTFGNTQIINADYLASNSQVYDPSLAIIGGGANKQVVGMLRCMGGMM